MHLRRWKQDDMPVVTTILADASLADTMSRWRCKHPMEIYYASHRWATLKFIRENWRQPGRQAFVLVADKDEKASIKPTPAHQQQFPIGYKDTSELEVDGELLIGWMWCSRFGKSPTALKWQQMQPEGYVSNAVERALRTIERVATSWIPNYDPIRDPKKAALMGDICIDWDKEIFEEAWELEGMGVHPDFHRRGYGKILLDWVLERAQEEGVPVVVKGSPFGGVMYKKYGFRSIGSEPFNKYFDELEFGGVRHGMWVWEPEGSDGKWYVRAKAKMDARETAQTGTST